MKWIEETAAKVLKVHADESLKKFATGCIMLDLLYKLKVYMKHFDAKFVAKHDRCCCLLIKLVRVSPDVDNETCKEFEFIQSGTWTWRYVLEIALVYLNVARLHTCFCNKATIRIYKNKMVILIFKVLFKNYVRGKK